MWSFSNKNKSNIPLRPLNEKEIQEKLYGTYRKKSQRNLRPASSAQLLKPLKEDPVGTTTTVKSVVERVEASEFIESPSVTQAEVSSESELPTPQWLKIATHCQFNLLGTVQDFIRRLIALFAWKYTSAVVIGAIILFSVAQIPWSDIFSKSQKIGTNDFFASEKKNQIVIMSRSDTTQVEVVDEGKTSEQPPVENIANDLNTKPAETDEAQSIQTESDGSDGGEMAPPAAARQYTIQVCTYVAETDAQGLVDKLIADKLPAFYEPSGNLSGGQAKFYVVYLGRDNSYTDSRIRLNRFKTMPIAQDFTDAFIRRS